MCLVTAQPPGFTPARFPKMGGTGNFSACAGLEKPAGHPVLSRSRKCQGQNGKRQFSSECARLIEETTRSALARLADQGLVTLEQNKGAIVTPLDAAEWVQLSAVQIALARLVLADSFLALAPRDFATPRRHRQADRRNRRPTRACVADRVLLVDHFYQG
jgi:hypothetical protein